MLPYKKLRILVVTPGEREREDTLVGSPILWENRNICTAKSTNMPQFPVLTAREFKKSRSSKEKSSEKSVMSASISLIRFFEPFIDRFGVGDRAPPDSVCGGIWWRT